MKRLRILLVDDSRFFRESAADLLATFENVEVIAQAASATEAFEEITRAQPDLVIMDISMPHMSGLEATARIKTRPNAPAVMLVTLHGGNEFRAAAEAAGADRFVPKELLFEAMNELITHHLLLAEHRADRMAPAHWNAEADPGASGARTPIAIA